MSAVDVHGLPAVAYAAMVGTDVYELDTSQENAEQEARKIGGRLVSLVDRAAVESALRQSGEAVATVCLVGDRYAHGNLIEVQLQLASESAPSPKIGDLYYLAPPATSGLVEALRSARTWHLGDKWRFGDDIDRAAWQRQLDRYDAILAAHDAGGGK